jgi:dihydroxyacetone kinase
MSYLVNDPAAFADESADGFVAANPALVRRVPGGVARATRTPRGRVAVVIGGGSGHYPAFAGLVGAGLADGAAMGHVFASPSAQQVYSVASSVANGGGVLLSYGNYAGDVLNFDQAQARLIEEGVPCRSVPVTDDIVSASDDERGKRRGIAGDLVVFKCAAWAADQGRDLDGVAAFAQHANERTRTLGVAFSGTTLPGAEEPLFTVPPGRMAVGMGIHGEPGIDELPLPTANDLAELFVERLLADRPGDVRDPSGARVGVILNGLGSVKSEELFVVYARVARLLAEAGVTIVDPEVGEFATSFEMAGVSLTLVWLDDELDQAWTAPAYTAGYRKGQVDRPPTSEAAPEPGAEAVAAQPALPAAEEESKAVAHVAAAAIRAIKSAVVSHVDELGRLDAIAGDGDHGIGMQRGATAAAATAEDLVQAGAGAGTVLTRAGDAWADRGGGTSGVLWGAALRAVGTSIGDRDRPTAGAVAGAIADALDAVTRIGKAQLGDKTMVDALEPFTLSLGRRVEDGERLADAWRGAARDATEAAAATKDLPPKLGRARAHLERSLGSPDPGAVSLALALAAVGEVLTTEGEGS